MRSLTTAAMLALTVVAAALPPSAVAASCRNTCAAVEGATVAQDCGECATTAVADLGVCLYKAHRRFAVCVADCPAFAGRCAITRDCVNRCRAKITGAETACETVFRAHVRRHCAGGRACLTAARRTRRQCVRQCSLAPASTPSAAAAGRCACQPRCIEGVVGDCFADCVDRCEGDQTALAICRRGCRNASCDALTNTCTTAQARPHGEYQRCCTACGNCQNDVNCATTTSSTTTTSTTSTPISTSTTLPTCPTLGATCGSCGAGLCVQHCAVGGQPVCVVAGSTTTLCTSDAGCSATAPLCAGLATDPVSCSDQGVGYCAAGCP